MIVLYSTKCPKCKVIETKLKQQNLCFKLVEDLDLVVSTGESHGISSAPILQVDDTFYGFSDAIKYLKEVK